MTNQLIRGKLYDNAADFFDLKGNAVMKLTPSAAKQVCLQCSEKQLIVGRVEGGIWHNPGFEARLDCIWDCRYEVEDSKDFDVIRASNLAAIQCIDEESIVHDAFIITVLSRP